MKNQKTTKRTQTKTTQKKKTRKLPVIHYDIRKIADYQKITDNQKTKIFVFVNLIQAVKEGIDAKVDQIPLVKLRGSNASLMLNRADWKKSLNRSINFFSEMEVYEQCQKAKELIEQL